MADILELLEQIVTESQKDPKSLAHSLLDVVPSEEIITYIESRVADYTEIAKSNGTITAALRTAIGEAFLIGYRYRQEQE